MRGRHILIISFAVLAVCAASMMFCSDNSDADSGICGDDLTWEFNEVGGLIISGTGAMYDYASPEEVPWHSHRAEINSISLAYEMTKVGAYAFDGCSGVKTPLSIQTYMEEIGAYAFRGCTGFSGTLTIPENVTVIGDHAFDGCSGFTGELTLPDGIERIGDCSFRGCVGFAGAIAIPAGVTYIGTDAFLSCSGITSIDVDEDNQNYSSENGILFDKGKTVLISCPLGNKMSSLNIPSTVTVISSNAFNGCTGIKGKLTIPNGVTDIGDYAFKDCTGLELSLIIPESVTSVGLSAFDGCTGFNGSLLIYGKIQYIGPYAFYYCSGLRGPLTLPDGVETIGSKAFYGCWKLSGTLTLPDSIKMIGYGAFGECYNLTTIILPDCQVGYNPFPSHTFYKEDGTKISPTDKGFAGHTYVGLTPQHMVREGHIVSYDLNGGTEPGPEDRVVGENAKFVADSYSGTKGSYVFGGWSYGGNTYLPGSEVTMGASDITLKAVWNEPAPSPSGGGDENTVLYVAIGVVAVVIALGTITFFFIRKNRQQ